MLITMVCAVLLAAVPSFAQKVSVSVNAAQLATLGTLNTETAVALSRHCSFHAGAAWNPWTFRKDVPGRQFQARRIDASAGIRWWPWHVHSGWWVSSSAMYREYNYGGITGKTTEEGDAAMIAFGGGYSLMLTGHLNIDFGLGIAGGHKWFTEYSCPKCGRITGGGSKWFASPDDIRISLVWVF